MSGASTRPSLHQCKKVKSTMMHTTMIIEDCTVIATAKNAEPPMSDTEVGEPSGWNVTVCDNFTGEERSCQMNYEEFAAMTYLLLGNDDDSDVAKIMYGRCEHLFKDWPNNCRPIP